MNEHRAHELRVADYAAGRLADAEADDFEVHLLS